MRSTTRHLSRWRVESFFVKIQRNMPPREEAAEFIAPVHETRGRRLRFSGADRAALKAQAEASRSRLEAIMAKQRPADDPSRQEAELVYENDNLELENYDKKSINGNFSCNITNGY